MWIPNDEQKKVLEYDFKSKNLLVSAAAGSGKTRVLTEKIVSMMIKEGISLKDILVMTFTVKATQEMKSRIKNAIEEAINSNTYEDVKEKLIRESSLIQNANITTIDSFCKSILEKYYTVLNDSNGLYAKFDPAYRIADEKELSILYDDVLNNLLEEVVYNDLDEYGDFIKCYFKKDGDTKLKEEMFLKAFDFLASIPSPMKKLNKWIDNFDNEKQQYLDNINSETKNEIIKSITDYKNAKSNFGNDIDEVLSIYETNISKLTDEYINAHKNPDKNRELKSRLISLRDKLKSVLELLNDLENVDSNLDFTKIFNNKLYNNINISSLEAKSNVSGKNYDNCKENVEKLLKLITPFTNRSEKISNLKYSNSKNELVFLKLLKVFYEKVIEEKVNRNIYAISDYAILAHEILSSENASIIDDIREKYKYILIDEYQDTSLIQEEILLKISKKNNLMMVGDVKQSIYGFRNAEPSIFINKIDEAKTKNVENDIINMNVNYRSSAEIIGFVNELFDVIMTKDFSGIDYKTDGEMFPDENANIKADEVDKIQNRKFDKKVEVHYVCSEYLKKSKEENNDIAKENLDDDSKISANEVEAEFIARKIEDLVKNHGFAYKDIVILFRSFYSKADTYIETLSKHNIPVFSEMKKGFFNRLEIKLMQDIFNVIDNEQQDIPVANVLCSSLFGVTNNELAFIKLMGLNFNTGDKFISSVELCKKYLKIIFEKEHENESNKSLDDILKFKEMAKQYSNIDLEKLERKLSSFVDKFESLRTSARYYSISELIEEIYKTLDVKNIMLSMNDGLMRVANLDALYDLAKGYENATFVGLFNFLRYIEKIKELKDDQGLAKISDENDNVVRIMTIHASKGLEFNCVFVAGCASNYNLRDTKDSLMIQTDVDNGIALDFYNLDKSYSISSPKKTMINKIKERNIFKEEMRMLYVALTRAKRKLIITASVDGRAGSYKKAFETYDKVFKYYNDNGKLTKNEDKVDSSEIDMITDLEKCDSYIDLILSSIKKESKYCDLYRDIIDVDVAENINTTKLNISKVVNEQVNDSIVDSEIEESKNIGDTKNIDNLYQVKKLLKKLDSDVLESNINGKYDYEVLKKIVKPKFSVSEIKKEHNFAVKKARTYIEEDIEIENDIEKDAERRDSTDIGNAYHRFMQFYKFEKVSNSDIINATILKSNENNNSAMEIIESDKINSFISSNLGIRMEKAYKDNKLYREQKFMKLFSQNEINDYLGSFDISDLPKENGKVFDEKNIIIQGIIDAFFVENGEIVVVDYKTDGLKNSNRKISKNTLIDAYKIQLNIYANVLEELTGLKVKEKCIYSFSLDEEIKL